MAFSALERAEIEKVVGRYIEQHRPPPEIRDQLDFAFRIENQSIEIFEIRPKFQDEKKKMEHPFAKATYVRTQNVWRVFWMRADLKWHGYEPSLEVKTIRQFLNVIEKDEYGCFFG